MAQEVITAFNSLADEYDSWYEKESLLFASEAGAVKHICPSPVKPTLEVGTGSGRFAMALGIDFGLDPSWAMLKLAKRRGIRTVQARGELMPLKNEVLGTVFIIFTLCFVGYPLDLFKECFRILKPEGQIVVAFINRSSLWARAYSEKKKAGHPLYSHAVFYNAAEVQDLLTASGFRVEGLCSTLLQPPGQVESIESPKEGFRDEAGLIVLLGRKSWEGGEGNARI